MSDKTREFEAWWESDGKYCRAGGGDYERTFAYEAWQAASATLAQQPAPAVPDGWRPQIVQGPRASVFYGGNRDEHLNRHVVVLYADEYEKLTSMLAASVAQEPVDNDAFAAALAEKVIAYIGGAGRLGRDWRPGLAGMIARRTSRLTAPPTAEQPTGTTSDQYRAELYDEVWEEARALGFGNVTEALSALARQQLDEKPDASAQLASIEVMCAMVEAREWADHVGVGEIGKRVESAISTLRNELQEAQRTAMAEHPDAVRVLHELPVDDIERRVASGHLRCTCPSGDGSLRWPCPAHPPSVSRT